MKLTNDEFNVEPEPNPSDVDLLYLMLRDGPVDTTKDASTNDGYGDCKCYEPKNTGKRKFLSNVQLASPQNPAWKTDN